jgi:WD40 repeat protein
MIDDLNRYLEHKTIRARPASRFDRLVRLVQRNPVVSGLTAIVLCLLLFLGTVSPFVAIRQSRLLRSETELSASLRVQQGLLRQQLYVSNINVAAEALEAGDIQRAKTLLQQFDVPRTNGTVDDLRGFEWYYLRRKCQIGTPRETLLAEGPGWTHAGTVRSVKFSPDGTFLAAGYWSHNVRIWRLSDKKVVRTFWTHGKVSSIDLSPDGQLVAATTETGEVCVWDIASEKLLQSMETTRDELNRVAFSPDGKLLAFPGTNQSVEIWRRADAGKLMTQFQPYRSLAITGAAIGVSFFPGSDLLVTGGYDRKVTVWDVESGTRQIEIFAHDATVRDVAVSPTGDLIASASADGTAKIWSADDGHLQNTLYGHSDHVNSVVFSRDGQRLVSCGWDGRFKLWNTGGGSEIATCHLHSAPVWLAAFSPDDATIATAGWDDLVKLWDVDDLSQQADRPLISTDSEMLAVAICPVSHDLAASTLIGPVRVWRKASWQDGAKHFQEFHSRDDRYVGLRLAYSPDGKLLAAGGGDWKLELRRADHAERKDSYGGTVILWDASTGSRVAELEGHTDLVTGVAFTPDAKELISSSADGSIRIWNVPTRELAERLPRYPSQVICIDLSNNGERLAAGTDENSIELWRREGDDWRLFRKLLGHKDWVMAVDFSPDGRTLASGSLDKSVKLWNVDDGTLLRTMPSYDSWILSLSFSPDGRTVASGSSDRRILLWNVATGQQLLTLDGHGNQIYGLEFSPDDSNLISACNDRTVRVWRAERSSLSFPPTGPR